MTRRDLLLHHSRRARRKRISSTTSERTSVCTTNDDNDEACQKFEAIMAVCAIVGLVAITCVFVVAGAFVGTKNSDSATIFQRRLETYKILRGVSES
jgi:hypothetical protein